MTIEDYKKICADAGVEFLGLQKATDGMIVLFLDPLTTTALAIAQEKFCNAAVQARVTKSRNEFPIELGIQSNIFDAIFFITRKHEVPREIVLNASVAATNVIKKFKNEEKEHSHVTS